MSLWQQDTAVLATLVVLLLATLTLGSRASQAVLMVRPATLQPRPTLPASSSSWYASASDLLFLQCPVLVWEKAVGFGGEAVEEVFVSNSSSSSSRDGSYVDVSTDEPQQYSQPPPYEVRASPGRGLGLFATRHIKQYSRVLTEAPQFVITPPSSSSSSSADSRFADMLSRIQLGFDSLAPADQAVYEACHEHRFPGEPDVGRLFYIFRSNAYSITPSSASASATKGQDRRETYWGMFPRMARINHSCRPNVANLWMSGEDDEMAGKSSLPRGKHVVWATRDIEAGEEILTSYINLLQDTPARQRSLYQFGFACDCAACHGESGRRDSGSGDSRDDDDAQRMHAGALLRSVEAFLGGDIAPDNVDFPQLLDDHLQKASALIQLLQGEAATEQRCGVHRHAGGALSGYLPRAYRTFLDAAMLAEGPGMEHWQVQAQELRWEEMWLLRRISE